MARYTTGSHTYEFDELQIIPDHACFVAGEAQVIYDWEPDDHDTGFKGGFEINIESIKLYGTTKNDPDLILPESHPLFVMIEKALRSDKHEHLIIDEIQNSQ